MCFTSGASCQYGHGMCGFALYPHLLPDKRIPPLVVTFFNPMVAKHNKPKVGPKRVCVSSWQATRHGKLGTGACERFHAIRVHNRFCVSMLDTFGGSPYLSWVQNSGVKETQRTTQLWDLCFVLFVWFFSQQRKTNEQKGKIDEFRLFVNSADVSKRQKCFAFKILTSLDSARRVGLWCSPQHVISASVVCDGMFSFVRCQCSHPACGFPEKYRNVDLPSQSLMLAPEDWGIYIRLSIRVAPKSKLHGCDWSDAKSARYATALADCAKGYSHLLRF